MHALKPKPPATRRPRRPRWSGKHLCSETPPQRSKNATKVPYRALSTGLWAGGRLDNPSSIRQLVKVKKHGFICFLFFKKKKKEEGKLENIP